jgi:hypothetical protein
MNQEIIAFGIVILTFLMVGMSFFKKYLAIPLSLKLLKRGHVKWAMRVRWFGVELRKSRRKCH